MPRGFLLNRNMVLKYCSLSSEIQNARVTSKSSAFLHEGTVIVPKD